MAIRTGGSDREQRFEEIYRKFYGRVYRYFRSNGVADDEAHDLAQDTFERLHKAFDQYRGEAEWSYLQKIARTILLNRVRAGKAIKRTAEVVNIDDPEVHKELEGTPQPDYADRQESTHRRQRLYAEIDALPDGQKECMKLWLGDLKYEGIAKVLGISMDAVKSRLRDAKRQLRARLGADVKLPEVDE